MTAHEINALVDRGVTVLARNVDIPRRGQPPREDLVEVTRAFDGRYAGELRVECVGCASRFRAEIVEIREDVQ